jgi:hypothetical protein
VQQTKKPHPVAGPRKQKTGGRKRERSAVRTNTPMRNALAEEKCKRSAAKVKLNLLAENKSRTKRTPANGKSRPKAELGLPKQKVKLVSAVKAKGTKKNKKLTACLVCGETFDDAWVQCLECKEWSHSDCTDGSDYYVCHNCEDD